MSEASVIVKQVAEAVKPVGEEAKIAAKVKQDKNRVIRNFTYELHDVEDIFTSKISFFLEELNKQLNALINSNIYTENKENWDRR